jgi:hypothetical protein
MPALLGHLFFASDQPWFWKHMLIQYVMGTASAFLPAYTLATLHEVSIIVRASAFQSGSIAHAGCRLVGGRGRSDAESLALSLELGLKLPSRLSFYFNKTNCGSMCPSRASAFTFDASPYVPQPFPALIKNRVLLHPQLF